MVRIPAARADSSAPPRVLDGHAVSGLDCRAARLAQQCKRAQIRRRRGLADRRVFRADDRGEQRLEMFAAEDAADLVAARARRDCDRHDRRGAGGSRQRRLETVPRRRARALRVDGLARDQRGDRRAVSTLRPRSRRDCLERADIVEAEIAGVVIALRSTRRPRREHASIAPESAAARCSR